jgi:hypothetical protein
LGRSVDQLNIKGKKFPIQWNRRPLNITKT